MMRRKYTAAERRELSLKYKIRTQDRTIAKLSEEVLHLQSTIREFYAGPIYKRRERLAMIREYHRFGGEAKGRELTKMTTDEIRNAIRMIVWDRTPKAT